MLERSDLHAIHNHLVEASTKLSELIGKWESSDLLPIIRHLTAAQTALSKLSLPKTKNLKDAKR
jgi:hypothetical protein